MFVITACDEKPSVRKVAAVLRAARGKGARMTDILSILTKFRETPGKHPGNNPETLFPLAGNNPETPRKPSRGRDKVIVKSLLPSPSGDGHVPPWLEKLREEVAAIDRLTLAELSVEQRIVLGRYHAYRFENYAASEAKNRNRGAKHVTPISDLGRSNDYGDVTVAEYRAYLQHLLKATGTLIRSPWALKGAIEESV